MCSKSTSLFVKIHLKLTFGLCGDAKMIFRIHLSTYDWQLGILKTAALYARKDVFLSLSMLDRTHK